MNKLVEKATELGIVKGFEVSSRGLTVAHLKLVDDTLFFCDPNRSEILGYRAIL